MATLQFPYYSLATSMKTPANKSSTKSLAAINLPDDVNDAADDLVIVSRLLSGLTSNAYDTTTLNTKQEVI